jgi:hypothetical protein
MAHINAGQNQTGPYRSSLRGSRTGRAVVVAIAFLSMVFGSVAFTASPAAALSSRDFSVRLSPTGVSVSPGSAATVRVVVVRGKKFRSRLNYRVSSTLPTVSTSIQLTASGPVVTLAVAPNATGALGQIVVTATGGGRVRNAIGTVQIVAPVTPPPVAPPPVPPSVAPVPAGDFTISVDQTTVNMVTGGSAVVGIRVNPTGSYTGSPRFEVAGLPAGISGAFVVPSSRTGTNLVLTAALNSARGDLPIVIRGVDGDKIRQVPVLLRIAGVGPFAMSAAFDPPRAAPGGSTTLKVQLISVSGLPIPEVDLTVGGLPAGATLSPPVIRTSSTATFQITFAAGTAAGDYAIPVRGVSGTFTQGLNPVITISAKPLVTLAAADLTIAQGGSATYPIVYSPVSGIPTPSYTVTGAPAGSSNTIFTAADGKQSIIVSTTASTPKGVYTLTLNAQSGTQITQVPFVLRVV